MFSFTEITYKFRIEYNEPIKENELLTKIDEAVKRVLKYHFSRVESIKKKIESGILSWSNPNSSLRRNSGSQATTCSSVVENISCILVDTSLRITYATAVFRREELRFIFLKLAKDMSVDFDFDFRSDYDGPDPKKINSIVTLHNFRPGNLNQHKSKFFFENTLRNFLNKSLEKTNPSLTVSLVKIVDKGEIEGVERESIKHRRRATGRRRKVEHHFSSVDVPVTILGEYQPPPDINFEMIVQESFTNNVDVFVEDLKTNERFSMVERVLSRSVVIEEVEVYGEQLSPNINDSAMTAEGPISIFSFLYSSRGMATYVVVAFLFLVSFISLSRLCAKMLEKKKRQADRMKFFSKNEMVFGSAEEEDEARAMFGFFY